MAATPTTYSSDLSWVGVAPEPNGQGTAPMPTMTMMLTKELSPKDTQSYLKDVGMRQAMTGPYGAQLGPRQAELTLDGDIRSDTQGFLLGNVLGDWTQTGTALATTTTTAGTNNAGATAISVTSSTGFTAGMVVQVGTGATAELVTIGTPAVGSLPIVQTALAATGGVLAFSHAAGQTVVNVGGAYTYQFAVQNALAAQSQSMIAQAHSLAFTDWTGVTATVGARTYGGHMVSDLSYDLEATKLATFAAKTVGWASQPSTATPTVAPGALVPIPAFAWSLGVGGPASGGTLMSNIDKATINIARQLKVYPAINGSKDPYIVKQGKLAVTGKLTFIAKDESPLTNYLTNVQPQLQFLITQGAGASLQTVQVDMQQVIYTLAQINRGTEAVEFEVDYEAIANTTNIGASGGFSPVMVTLKNNVALATY